MRGRSEPANITETIVHDLGVAIVTGRFNDGPFPKESELSQTYGAARTVTREAVKMLTSKGLLTSRRRRGIVINDEGKWNLLDPDVLRWLLGRDFSLSLLIEFTEIRLSIEPGAAALAAKRATHDERAGIAAAIDRMFAADQSLDDPLEADIAFHAAVLDASGNRFYRQHREMIATALRFSIRKTNDLKGVRFASALDHKRVADAILAGNPSAAETQMRQLIQGALDLMERVQRDEQGRV
ncbi:FadR/GntR family transcriptional regulator [Asticcacaulis sp. EMRT-3]|uniref:FadR/GntR family transcriptional regulator n=1 Tax=Asticcacaulis sp. EMRT-3 TaxID=3040349 RepID=UPI0024AFD44F|nr:FadR/GntR family transcriptional regulator [Asticcacaulis sp. EMRT-3]MDI7775092.1 FadR/GntR family transcriptional regulator [Asticcacaulis sp. EMRT-3]